MYDTDEAREVYRQVGLEWCQLDDRCAFINADKVGVHYRFMGEIRCHPWEDRDWEVFTPPADIIM